MSEVASLREELRVSRELRALQDVAIRDYRAEVWRLRAEKDGLWRDRAAFVKREEELRAEVARLRALCDEYREAGLTGLKAEVERLRALIPAQRTVDEAFAEVERLRDVSDEFQREVERLRERDAVTQEMWGDAEAELAEARATLADLRDEVDEVRAYRNRYRDALDAIAEGTYVGWALTPGGPSFRTEKRMPRSMMQRLARKAVS